jgi:carbonic anhydrase
MIVMKPARTSIFTVIIGILLSALASAAFAADPDRWSYGGANGPAKWSTLEKSYAICKSGEQQSPIDIPDATARKGDLPSLLFNYKPVPLKVIDNGHTIQVNYAPGSIVTVSGKRYELMQLEFHKPGEYKINGKGHDMSVNLVHKGPDNKTAIFSVFLDGGGDNAFMKALLDNLPREKGKEVTVNAVTVNALDLLPKNKGYYQLAGSLTTPPCSEDVTWFVLKTPVTVSADQIARFGRAYPMNARPLQPSNSRDVMGTL